MAPTRKKEVRSSPNGPLPSMPVLTDDTEVTLDGVEGEGNHEKVIEEEVKPSPVQAPGPGAGPGKEISTNCCKSSPFRLAYSSAMSKPVCLCIIWVHLQASISADQPIDTRLHRCMVKKRPKPASEGHQIVCHRCVIGFSSYNLYLDHLRSSPCGIQQQAANKPRGLNDQTWNSQPDKQSSMSSPITTSSSSQRSSDLIRLANLTHGQGQSCRNWNTHTPDSSTSSTSSSRKRKLNLQESSYSKFQQHRVPVSTPWVVSGPRYTAAQRYDWPFQMMQPLNQQAPGVFCHPSSSFHLPHPSMNPFEYNPSGFPYGGYGHPSPGHTLPPMRVARPPFGFQQVPQTFGVWQNYANELPNRGDMDLYCNWGWSRSGSQDVFKMSFDRWNQPFSHDQHRAGSNFSPGYSMNHNGPFQEFLPQQEIQVSGFNHQPSNEVNSNFILEKNEFNSTVTVGQEDLNLVNFGDENLFPLDYDLSLATIEISDVSENDLFGGSSGGDGINALDSLMFADEISSDGSSTNTLQEDLIQQAVNVCGVDDIFQLTPDATDISPEIQNHERDFPDDEDMNFSKMETGCGLNNNNRTPSSIVPQKCLKEGSKDPVLTSTATINLAPTLKPLKRYAKSVTVRSDSKAPDPSECPHLSVLRLPPIGANEQAKDQLQLICLQAKLGYVLLGLVGEARLKSYGYPILSVVQILQRILATCTTAQFLDEKSCCNNNHCPVLDKSLDQEQLAYRFVKLRVQLLRSNILKLLHLCVPSRQKWQEFGWNTKSVDDIMEELTQQDIPKYRLGDPVLSAISKKISKKFL